MLSPVGILALGSPPASWGSFCPSLQAGGSSAPAWKCLCDPGAGAPGRKEGRSQKVANGTVHPCRAPAPPGAPRAAPDPDRDRDRERRTWSRNRRAARSMASREARCRPRARLAAPRAAPRRPDQRRANAAATRQQASAAPDTPLSSAHIPANANAKANSSARSRPPAPRAARPDRPPTRRLGCGGSCAEAGGAGGARRGGGGGA